LQQKIDGIKAESDTDIDIEEGSICIKTDDTGWQSTVCKKEAGPEVSSFLCLMLGSYAVPVWW
jgi:hypothetical protein